MSVTTTTDSRGVPLNEAPPALVPDEGVHFVPLVLLTKSAGIFHERGLAAGHCGNKDKRWDAKTLTASLK